MSKIKVNTIETRTGSTLTLGKSGDTVSIASGASTSGMGRTGTVDWQTSSIKTESFTSANGEGYFVDTADGTPFKNYAVTVASGTLYLVGGTGNVFNLDASQQTAITLIKGKTYRFTQSDSSNDGHQLIISTSNSTTLGTFQAGIVSSGITYYIDGSATQSNWLNSTTFNAGTTRYIEFQPQSTGTFYFGCYNHGIGMGGAITSQNLTVTLPSSPSAGNIVAIKDYSLNFNTNLIEIDRNGSVFNGTSGTDNPEINTQGASIVLVYVDGTKGWVPTQDDSSSLVSESPVFVAASGGNSCGTDGDYKYHVFTSPGTFTVSNGGNCAGSNSVEYLVVAGGGGGGAYTPSDPGAGGGGGAGGFRISLPSLACISYPAKPLSGSNVPVTATAYPIVIGAGGAAQNPGTNCSSNGSDTVFSTITSTGGGGTNNAGSNGNGKPGGSGGGAGGTGLSCRTAGSGNTPPVSPPQGNNGGTYTGGGSPYYATAGGGGATAVGESLPDHNRAAGGNGGAGGGFPPTTFGSNGVPCGSFRYYAGGGAGSVYTTGSGSSGGTGGVGGGGNGLSGSGTASAGTTNSGGGGGGHGKTMGGTGGAGGSGIVIIRYKYQ